MPAPGRLGAGDSRRPAVRGPGSRLHAERTRAGSDFGSPFTSSSWIVHGDFSILREAWQDGGSADFCLDGVEWGMFAGYAAAIAVCRSARVMRLQAPMRA